MLQPRSSLKIGQALQSIRYKATNHSQRESQSEGLGSHARLDRFHRHALHGIVKPTRQAQLPLRQLQRLQSLQRHYPMPRTVSVATQRGHWEP